MPEINYYV